MDNMTIRFYCKLNPQKTKHLCDKKFSIWIIILDLNWIVKKRLQNKMININDAFRLNSMSISISAIQEEKKKKNVSCLVTDCCGASTFVYLRWLDNLTLTG